MAVVEVFIRSRNGLDHKHCGSCPRARTPLALQVARDVTAAWKAYRSAVKGLTSSPPDPDAKPELF